MMEALSLISNYNSDLFSLRLRESICENDYNNLPPKASQRHN